MQVLKDSPDSLLASLVSGNEPGRLIIVTGPSGSGKTRWCQALAEQAMLLGIQVCGLLSPAVFNEESKTGIDLLDLRSGMRRRLAVRRRGSDEDKNCGAWRFNEVSLDWGNTILKESTTCQLFILDELGPLEFQHGTGLTGGFGVLAGRKYHLACVVVRESLLEASLALWPWAEVLSLPSVPPSQVSS